MQKKGRNISLASYEDIFSTEESRREAAQERVQEIPLSELHPFKGHPFKVVDDEAMMKTVESIRNVRNAEIIQRLEQTYISPATETDITVICHAAD